MQVVRTDRLGWVSAMWVAAALCGPASPTSEAGPYSAHSSDPGNASDAPIAVGDPRIKAFANTVVDYSPAPGVTNEFAINDDPAAALGAPNGATVSLGDLYSTAAPPPVGVVIPFGPPAAYQGDPNDPADDYGFIGIDAVGSITLGVAAPIGDGAGPDFAVFENGFDNSFSGDGSFVFAELAYVEVSTDGAAFARFDSVSTHTEAEMDQTFGRDFAAVDPTNVFNLAGKHLANWGTPFDLANLVAHPLVVSGDVDLSDIRFVRLVDIPGNGDFSDAQAPANPVFDSWVSVGTGGLDVDAVAVLNPAPEPGTLAVLAVGAMFVLGGRGKRQTR